MNKDHALQANNVLVDALVLLSTSLLAAENVEMLWTAGCGCCIGWMRHLEKAGCERTNENLATANLNAKKMEATPIPSRRQ